MIRAARWVAAAAMLAGLLSIADAARILLKGWLAQVLLEDRWAEARASGAPARPPWPWADTRPVARLKVPALAVDQVVLDGASGRNLAFGPAHVAPSAAPGGPGHVVLSGHRDTHFEFLPALRPGMAMIVEGPGGTARHYRVTSRETIDVSREALALDLAADRLTLATCDPATPLGSDTPRRLLVHATAVAALPEPTAAEGPDPGRPWVAPRRG